jgi:catechol 2,3-dioxygenase-like lactoylglutathione lyase family enzyme
MNVARLDHLVLTVADVDRTCEFYESVLGMRRITFGDGRTAMRFGDQKLNLHQHGNEVFPNARHAAPGTADLCFILETPIEQVVAELEAAGVPIELGPAEKDGALGPITSVYIRDPDENLIELSNYPRS